MADEPKQEGGQRQERGASGAERGLEQELNTDAIVHESQEASRQVVELIQTSIQRYEQLVARAQQAGVSREDIAEFQTSLAKVIDQVRALSGAYQTQLGKIAEAVAGSQAGLELATDLGTATTEIEAHLARQEAWQQQIEAAQAAVEAAVARLEKNRDELAGIDRQLEAQERRREAIEQFVTQLEQAEFPFGEAVHSIAMLDEQQRGFELSMELEEALAKVPFVEVVARFIQDHAGETIPGLEDIQREKQAALDTIDKGFTPSAELAEKLTRFEAAKGSGLPERTIDQLAGAVEQLRNRELVTYQEQRRTEIEQQFSEREQQAYINAFGRELLTNVLMNSHWPGKEVGRFLAQRYEQRGRALREEQFVLSVREAMYLPRQVTDEMAQSMHARGDSFSKDKMSRELNRMHDCIHKGGEWIESWVTNLDRRVYGVRTRALPELKRQAERIDRKIKYYTELSFGVFTRNIEVGPEGTLERLENAQGQELRIGNYQDGKGRINKDKRDKLVARLQEIRDGYTPKIEENENFLSPDTGLEKARHEFVDDMSRYADTWLTNRYVDPRYGEGGGWGSDYGSSSQKDRARPRVTQMMRVLEGSALSRIEQLFQQAA